MKCAASLSTSRSGVAVRYLTRKSLCEIRYRDTNREVAAFMAYESAK
ncbi:Hok/Gef family protein [Salmonella enterica]|nr:Hok/Gef family protein [Salmonella enterica]EDE2726643.1 Hok/Gef family protein [Salmonella enterica]EEH4705618.1 Hok/Gef family protein [Salmonella enterica]